MTITRPRRSDPRRAPGALARWLAAGVAIALPAPCLGCGRPGDGGRVLGLCLACRGRLRRPAPGCGVCGTPIPAAALAAAPAAAGGVASAEPAWVCGACRRRPPPFRALVVPWSYEGPITAVVRGLKFGRLDYLGAALAGEIAAALEAADASREPDPGALVVPVPLHWRRRLRRGYNQAERIARPLARLLGLPFAPVLRRRRATPPQSGLDRTRRLAGPVGAFAVSRPRRLAAAGRVVLVDDVVTTGATLAAAAAALRAAGCPEVLAVAAARTPEGA